MADQGGLQRKKVERRRIVERDYTCARERNGRQRARLKRTLSEPGECK